MSYFCHQQGNGARNNQDIERQFLKNGGDKKLLRSGKSELNTDAWKIAQKYLWPWFLFDIITILPIPQVLGAFWYFFSTQRPAACWHKACDQNRSRCVGISFDCDHSFGNLSFINDICSLNTENKTSFNFGIFLKALQSGVLESEDFPQIILQFLVGHAKSEVCTY
nr:cyclic nucleotide-gated ion channel 1 [Quercus suber]